MLTDADAVFLDWGKPEQRAIHKATPAELRPIPFAAGSMGPKVYAACHFAEVTGKTAAIGALADLPAIFRGEKGTLIDQSHGAMSFY